MNTLQSFSYESNEVRTVMIDGEPWFVLRDVCQVLGISHVKDTADRLDQDEVGQTEVIDSLGRKQTVTIISESGLYAVILRSDKPEAKPFRKWVTAEVLPTIRKKGGYISGQTALSTNELMAKALIAAQKILESQSPKLTTMNEPELVPPNDVWDRVEFEWMCCFAVEAKREDYLTVLYLARYAGLRVEECFNIESITAAGAIGKMSLNVYETGGYRRRVPISKLLAVRFAGHLGDEPIGSRLLLPRGQQVSKAVADFQKFFDQYSRKAVRKGRPLTFDGLRHTYAAEKYQGFIHAEKTPYEARKAVSRLLGHGRDDVTNIYLASLRGGVEDA